MLSLNSEPCLARPSRVDLNSNKFYYYSFMASLDRCNWSCNTLNDLSVEYVSKKTENINLNVVNL